MAGATRRRGLAGVVILGLASGCWAPLGDAEAEARLARLEAEDSRLRAAFDSVETRLLGEQGRVHLWQELGRRHADVSAIQCRVTEQHLAGMARHLEHQADKERQLAQQRSMAVAGSPALTSAQP
jgi:hypothetical protein